MSSVSCRGGRRGGKGGEKCWEQMAEWPLCSAAWVIMDTAVSHFACKCVCAHVCICFCVCMQCVCVPLTPPCVLLWSERQQSCIYIHVFIAPTDFCKHNAELRSEFTQNIAKNVRFMSPVMKVSLLSLCGFGILFLYHWALPPSSGASH